MKRAIIFHGTDCTPDDFWYKWLGQQLGKRGYNVEIPHYPTLNREPIETFMPKVLQSHSFDEETVIIGHSAGGPLLLSILENVDRVLPQAILVAGYCEQQEGNDTVDVVLQESYNWDSIRSHVKDIVFINSDDDPWGCDDKQGRKMFDHLGGTQIIRHEGHFGSTTYNQPFPTFDLLNKLIA